MVAGADRRRNPVRNGDRTMARLGSDEGRPTEQYDPDAQLSRMFGVGCLVLVIVFLVGSAVIGWIWTH